MQSANLNPGKGLPNAANPDGLEPSVFWQDRVARFLSAAGPRSHLVCDKASGIELALNRLSMDNIPLLSLYFLEKPSPQDLSIRLARAIERSLGVRLVLEDAPYKHSLAILGRELVRLGPVRLAVIWSDYCLDFVEELGNALGPMSQVISIAHSPESGGRLSGSFQRLAVERVLMTDYEAVVAAGDTVDAERAISLAKDCGYLYGAFIARIDPALETGSTLEYAFHGDDAESPIVVPHSTLLNVLVERGRWIEAFELACNHLPSEVRRVVVLAGHQLVDLGAFEYLWDGLSKLPRDLKKNPDVAYWLVVAASATNRIPLVRDLAEEVLLSNEAPDLRAAVAVLHPNVDMVTETERAVRAMETPTTLRAMAFALAYAGDRHSPIRLFRRAMERAESLRANHLVVACAIDIANQEITLGRYRNGVDWARWAIHELDRRRSNEQFRRHAATALVVYGTILSVGDTEIGELSPLVRGLWVDSTRIGAPTYESVVSTVGDWHFASRNYEAAEDYYRSVLDAVPLSQYASAALDVVRVLIAQGRNAEARGLAEASRTLATTSTLTEQALADLGLGMATARSHPEHAQQLLNSALDGLAKSSYVIFEAQAILWMALSFYVTGRRDMAASMLRQGVDGIAGLGPTGWAFLLCGASEWSALRDIWHSTSEFVHLDFMGDRQVVVDGRRTRAPLRMCEILAVLSENESGVTGERLRLMVFGDESTAANTKATVSRMRKLFPISQAPYRLTSRVRTDFGELVRRIENGDVTEAVSLYKGQLLPGSEAPAVVELRNYIDEAIKAAVLASGDVELMIKLGNLMEGELEIWERARAIISPSDHRRGLLNARIRRIRANWEL